MFSDNRMLDSFSSEIEFGEVNYTRYTPWAKDIAEFSIYLKPEFMQLSLDDKARVLYSMYTDIKSKVDKLRMQSKIRSVYNDGYSIKFYCEENRYNISRKKKRVEGFICRHKNLRYHYGIIFDEDNIKRALFNYAINETTDKVLRSSKVEQGVDPRVTYVMGWENWSFSTLESNNSTCQIY